MTDIKIIEALTICHKGNGDSECEKCPYVVIRGCMDILGEDALDLINRQQAEIEKLKAADVQPVKHGYWIFKKRIKLVPTGQTVVAEDKTALTLRKRITVKVPYCSICSVVTFTGKKCSTEITVSAAELLYYYDEEAKGITGGFTVN